MRLIGLLLVLAIFGLLLRGGRGRKGKGEGGGREYNVSRILAAACWQPYPDYVRNKESPMFLRKISLKFCIID